jgi:hypothetical protein
VPQLRSRIVDDGLIVAASGTFDLVAEQGKDFVIETHGHSCFRLGNRNDSACFALRKSYSRFMMFLVLSSLSGCGRACRDPAHTSTPGVNHDEDAAKCIPSHSDPPLLFH